MKIRIQEIRNKMGITQEVLAKAAGISRPYLAQLETGVRNLSLKTQIWIARALDVDPSELIDFSVDEEEEAIILDAFRSGSREQRAIWLSMAKGILAGQSQD